MSDNIECKRCSCVVDKIYNGERVEYCEYCGNKLYNSCPYCNAEVTGEKYYADWVRCERCHVPLLGCEKCDILFPLGTTACSDCGSKIGDTGQSNIYRSPEPPREIKLPPGGVTAHLTSSPSSVNNFIYFWSSQDRNSNAWRLTCFDVFEGKEITVNAEITSTKTLSINTKIFGSYLMSTTDNEYWVHDLSQNGKKVFSKAINMPFVACITESLSLITLHYNKRQNEEVVTVYSDMAMPSNAIEFNRSLSSTPFDLSILVSPIQVNGTIYLSSFVSGILVLEKDGEQVYRLSDKVVLQDKRVCHLVNANSKIYFSCYDKIKNEMRWGVYTVETDYSDINQSNLLHYHQFGVHEDGVIICEEKPEGASLMFYELLNDKVVLDTHSKLLINMEEFEEFSLMSTGGGGLFCIYCYKSTPPNNYYRVAWFNFSNTSLTQNIPGATFTDTKHSYYINMCNYLILFIHSTGKTTIKTYQVFE